MNFARFMSSVSSFWIFCMVPAAALAATTAASAASATSTTTAPAASAASASSMSAGRVTADLDKEIHDNKMRAQSGSKSKLSSSVSFSYYGSSLRKPFDDARPNVSDELVEAPVSMRGNVGLRYRFDKNRSLFLATGFSQDRPLSGGESGHMEVSTPMVHYNSTFRFEDIQVSNSWMFYYNTLDYLKQIGQRGTVAYSLSALSQMGESRFEGGMSLTLWGSYYDKDEGVFAGHSMDLKPMQSDYGLGLSPRVQYRVSDRWNVYTSVDLLQYRHVRSEKATDLEKIKVSQSLGAGIAVLRDFYLAPNLSFQPADIQAKKTAVNLTAIINVL